MGGLSTAAAAQLTPCCLACAAALCPLLAGFARLAGQPACCPLCLPGLLRIPCAHRLAYSTCAEWNTSRSEVANLVDFGLLTHAELASCIVSSWASVQVSLYGSEPVNCGGDILDCGVSPK